MRRTKMCLACVLSLVSSAFAQVEEIFFEVSNPNPMPGETITITMKAGFSPPLFAMAAVGTNVEFSTLQGELTNWRVVSSMRGPGTTPGVLVEGAVEGIIAGQLNFPLTAGIFADATNPIPFWAVDLRVADELRGPVVFEASTRTTRYDVFISRNSSVSVSRLDFLTEGVLRVVVARACAVDLDGDGVATIFDFLAFFNLFSAGDLLADFDGDVELTLFDFLEYQNLFALGC